MKTLVFDLDGTLYRWTDGAKPNYNDPDAILCLTEPIPGTQELVVDVVKNGWIVYAVTGRSKFVQKATLQRMALDFPDIDEHRVYHVGPFQGWDAYTHRKAAALAGLCRNGVYVGDRREDHAAASMAGWEFFPAEKFQVGLTFEHLLAGVPAA